MTVPATPRKAGPYAGNGVTTAFPFAFKVFSSKDIQPVLTDSNGAATNLILDSDYSVLLNADQDANPGGTVNYPILVGPSPLPVGSTLTIIGNMSIDQLTDITNSGRFLPQVFENAYDKLTILIQQLKEISDRTLQAAVGTTVKLIFPAPSSGKFIRWRTDLTGLENVDAGTDSIALQGLLADASDPTHGSAMVGFKPPGIGIVGRTLASKLLDYINVKDYGAVGDGIANDTVAFTNAVAAASNDATIFVPAGKYNITAISTSKKLLWDAKGAYYKDGIAPISDYVPGVVIQSRGNVVLSRHELHMGSGSTATDYAVSRVKRNASHTGGTTGYVNSGFRVDVDVGAGVSNYEWAIVGVVQNYATVGENVGVYGQGNMRSTGGTWGGVMEATDATFTSSTGKNNLIGCEVDCYFNDNDPGGKRFGLTVIAGDAKFNRTGVAGIAGYATYGILIQAQGGGANCSFKTGVVVNSATETAFQASSPGGATWGLRVLNTYDVGVDTSGATINVAALRMASGQRISFDASSAHQLHEGTLGQVGLIYSLSGVDKSILRGDGGIGLNAGVMVIPGTYNTGTATATIAANKPGANTASAAWISVQINGSQFWVPAWPN